MRMALGPIIDPVNIDGDLMIKIKRLSTRATCRW